MDRSFVTVNRDAAANLVTVSQEAAANLVTVNNDAIATAIGAAVAAGFRKLDSRLDRIEGRLDRIEGRLDRIEGRLDRIEGRLDSLEDKIDASHDQLSYKIDMITQTFQRQADTLTSYAAGPVAARSQEVWENAFARNAAARDSPRFPLEDQEEQVEFLREVVQDVAKATSPAKRKRKTEEEQAARAAAEKGRGLLGLTAGVRLRVVLAGEYPEAGFEAAARALGVVRPNETLRQFVGTDRGKAFLRVCVPVEAQQRDILDVSKPCNGIKLFLLAHATGHKLQVLYENDDGTMRCAEFCSRKSAATGTVLLFSQGTYWTVDLE